MGKTKLKTMAEVGLSVLTLFSYCGANTVTIKAANEEITQKTKRLKAGVNYSVSNSEGMVKLSELQADGRVEAGAKIELTTDINLAQKHCPRFEKWADQYTQWTPAEAREFAPIGSCVAGGDGQLVRRPFKGCFNGNGHSIKLYLNRNGKDYNGLFGYVGAKGAVLNLTVLGVVSAYPNKKSEMGWFTGGVAGANFGRIVNVCNKALVSSSSEAGGVVGKNGGTVKGCKNEGTVDSGANVGGLVGWNKGKVLDCVNSGRVWGSATCVGGVAGYNSGENSKISNCCNTAEISAAVSSVGGIAGKNSARVQNCYNVGAVESKDQDAGGLVGENTAKGLLVNGYNLGKITGIKCVGGVVGYKQKGSKIVNCYYLEGTSQGAVNGSDRGCKTAKKTEKELISSDFVALLNGKDGSAFVAAKGRAPKLSIE